MKNDKHVHIVMVSRVFPNDSVGGSEIYFHEVWKRISERKRYKVSLISGWSRNPNLLPEDSIKIKMHGFNGRIVGFRFFRFSHIVTKLIEKLKPDIVHSNSMEIRPIDINVPFIFTVHHIGHLYLQNRNFHRTVFDTKYILSSSIYRKIIENNLKKATKVISVSFSTKLDLVLLTKIPEENISVIYPGIDFEKFRPRNKNIIRRKLGIDTDKFVIFLPSRIVPNKGQTIAIKAFRNLPESVRKKSLLVIGGYLERKYVSYYTHLVKLSKNENILFVTNIKNIEEYYNAADLVIFPTMAYEGLGFVVLESLACQKPVIASNYPAVREAGRKYSLYFDVGNYLMLSELIETVYKNYDAYERIARRGRKYVLRTFDWKKSFMLHEKIYSNLVG